MTDTVRTNGSERSCEESSPAASPEKKKQVYVKPAYRYEKVFVTTALSCGKVSSTQSNCVHQPKAS